MLDIKYRTNSRIVPVIKGPESMAVLGAGPPLELPLALFQVLIAFVGGSSARQVLQNLDFEIDAGEFDRIIAKFVEGGLLKADISDDGPSLERLLNPAILSDARLIEGIRSGMRQGRAIIIRDALPIDFAEEVYHDLCQSSQWRVAEGGHDFFHYRNSVIDHLEDQSPALTACHRLFSGPSTRRFIANMSGQDCSGETNVAAAWYRPCEYALPHNDLTIGSRSVAYIWYLTKDWRQEWGGSLFWCPTGQYVSPRFNLLVLFNITPSNVHLVCPVAPIATGKRLTVNGFWHRSGNKPPPAMSSQDALVSQRLRGLTPDQEDMFPLIVL